MVATSTLMMGTPLLAAVTAGIGNALLPRRWGKPQPGHCPGKATLPGIFVAPGALGLTIGILIGKSGSFVAWPFFLLLLGSTALILASPQARRRC